MTRVEPPTRAVRGLLLVAIVAALGGTAPALAAPAIAPPDRAVEDAIEVSRGATCLDGRQLAGHVRTWLGRSRVGANVRVFVRGDATSPTSVEFRIARDGLLRYRRFDALPGSCYEANAAVGLAIALAIDANAMRTFVEPAKPPPGLLNVGLGAGYEVLPGASLGGAAGLEYGLLDWLGARAELAAQYSWNDSIDHSTGRFDVLLVFASLGACTGGAPLPRLRVGFCGGFAGGVIHSEGHGYTVSRSASGIWLGALAGVRVVLRIGVPWVLDLDMLVPVDAPSFRVERPNVGDLFRYPATAGGLLNLGPGFEF